MKKFEYLEIDSSDSYNLDELGAEGWELVTAIPWTETWNTGGMSDHYRDGYKLFFKREIASV